MTKPTAQPAKYCKQCNTPLKYAKQRKNLICRECNDKAYELNSFSVYDIEADLEVLVNPSGKTRVHDYDTISGYKED